MTSDAILVVRYREAERSAAERTIQRVLRIGGILQLVLAVVFGLLGPGAVLAAAIVADQLSATTILVIGLLLVIPILLFVFGVRQLRRRVHLPDVAVTITPTAVIFPAIDRVTVLSRRPRAEEWSREGTSARILPASGFNAARIAFTRQDNGKRRQRTVAAGTIDVDSRTIVDALSGTSN